MILKMPASSQGYSGNQRSSVRFDTYSYELSIHALAEEIDICRNGGLLRPARNIAGEEAGMPDGRRISVTVEIESACGV